MKNSFFICLIVLGLSSCKKDVQAITLSGKYVEISPKYGRSQLEFTKHNILIKTETGGTSRDSFKYEIINSKIRLTPTWAGERGTYEFEFWILNDAKIKIQNLYATIPEMPPGYMIYEK
jgi:hypothetical protein